LDENSTLEGALASTQSRAEAALDTAGRMTAALRRARSAASTGDTRDLRRAIATAERLTSELTQTVTDLAGGYRIDEVSYLASGAYVRELRQAADEADLTMLEEDNLLLCYPSLVRVLASEQAVSVDRRKERRLRPSVLVATLAEAQRKGPRFRPEPFLASLQRAYDLVIAERRLPPGAVVRLLAMYDVFTVLPGQAREYPRPEFARDLYLLDQSGVTTAKDGRRMRWAASSGTRGSDALTTVSHHGQPKRYYGVAFEDAASSPT
jgi:hypothetical protein